MHTHTQHVLFDANPITLSKTGIGHFSERLLMSLADDGIFVTAYYFNFLGKRNINLPAHPNIRYKELRILPSKLINILNRVGVELPLELFVSTRKISSVIFTNYVSMPTFRHIKKISLVYDLSFFDSPEFTAKRNLRSLRKMVPRTINRSDKIITISTFSKNRLCHHFPHLPAENIIVLPIPYEPRVTINDRVLGESIKVLVNQKYILHVGTIEPRKNLDNLVSAFEQDSSISNSYLLVLAGGIGWKTDALLEQIKSSPINHRIVLTGYITDDERDALYENSSLTCSLSHYEGFGMPILEAGYYNSPLLLSDIPPYHEVAGGGAVYCDQEKPSSIRQGIVTALLRKKWSTNMLGKEYSWARNMQKIRSLL